MSDNICKCGCLPDPPALDYIKGEPVIVYKYPCVAEQIRYPEEVKAKKKSKSLTALIQAEMAKGRVYGHFS